MTNNNVLLLTFLIWWLSFDNQHVNIALLTVYFISVHLSVYRRCHCVTSLGHRVAWWPHRKPVSRGWQGQIQCHCGVGLSCVNNITVLDRNTSPLLLLKSYLIVSILIISFLFWAIFICTVPYRLSSCIVARLFSFIHLLWISYLFPLFLLWH